ncbi:WXG100-like domain-containing protein [Crossiella cryophila]|uniref:Outer membrane murein-binding lipoprotein Lpp n=1 Tax=Crossiella cryophila TaxID=43355 RepID=A0A7W7CL10_9PSEU|nr:ADP-ribosyltransferase [Crossiella cryophila]MBB4681409.1 outer membrane murein-binding lipoprotein Lpp [Crossiella cryophila]
MPSKFDGGDFGDVPAWARTLLEILGMSWPAANQHRFRRLGEDYDQVARKYADTPQLIADIEKQIRQHFDMGAAEQFRTSMKPLTDGSPNLLEELSTGAKGIADGSRKIALQVEYAKYSAIGQLFLLAYEIAMEYALSAITGGASLANLTWHYAATRQYLMAIFKQLTRVATLEVFIGVSGGLIIDAVVQRLQRERESWDTEATMQTLLSGVIGGVIGGTVGELGEALGRKLGGLLGKDYSKLATDDLKKSVKDLDLPGADTWLNDLGRTLSDRAGKELGNPATAFTKQSIENFAKQTGDRFVAAFGKNLGEDTARQLGRDYAKSFVDNWARHGLDGTPAFRNSLRDVLAPQSGKLGKDAVRLLSQEVPDVLARNTIDHLGGNLAAKAAMYSTMFLAEGVSGVMTMAVMAQIDGQEVGAAEYGMGFLSGTVMGGIGHGIEHVGTNALDSVVNAAKEKLGALTGGVAGLGAAAQAVGAPVGVENKGGTATAEGKPESKATNAGGRAVAETKTGQGETRPAPPRTTSASPTASASTAPVTTTSSAPPAKATAAAPSATGTSSTKVMAGGGVSAQPPIVPTTSTPAAATGSPPTVTTGGGVSAQSSTVPTIATGPPSTVTTGGGVSAQPSTAPTAATSSPTTVTASGGNSDQPSPTTGVLTADSTTPAPPLTPTSDLTGESPIDPATPAAEVAFQPGPTDATTLLATAELPLTIPSTPELSTMDHIATKVPRTLQARQARAARTAKALRDAEVGARNQARRAEELLRELDVSLDWSAAVAAAGIRTSDGTAGHHLRAADRNAEAARRRLAVAAGADRESLSAEVVRTQVELRAAWLGFVEGKRDAWRAAEEAVDAESARLATPPSGPEDAAWRHSRVTTAPWFAVDKPLDPTAWEGQRATTPRRAVDTETADVLTTLFSSADKRYTGLIRYGVSRFEVDGRGVTEFTVPINLVPGAGVGPDQLDQLRVRAQTGLDTLINQRYGLPNGDQLHVRVEFTANPGLDGHDVLVDPGQRTTQTTWQPSATAVDLAHELIHYLGPGDESLDPDRVFLRRADDGAGAVVTGDRSLMGGDEGELRLLPRHAWMIHRVLLDQVGLARLTDPGQDALPGAAGAERMVTRPAPGSLPGALVEFDSKSDSPGPQAIAGLVELADRLVGRVVEIRVEGRVGNNPRAQLARQRGQQRLDAVVARLAGLVADRGIADRVTITPVLAEGPGRGLSQDRGGAEFRARRTVSVSVLDRGPVAATTAVTTEPATTVEPIVDAAPEVVEPATDAEPVPDLVEPPVPDAGADYPTAAALITDLVNAVRPEPTPHDLLGPDLFDLRTASPPPDFLAGLDQTTLTTGQLLQLLETLNLTLDAPPDALTGDTLDDPADWVIPTERSVDALTQWAPGVVPPLPNPSELPALLHAIWLGGPLRNTGHMAGFRRNYGAAANGYAEYYRAVLWTDVPRARFEAAGQPGAPAELAEVRDMLDWARDNQVRLVNVDEVFNSAAPMRLQQYYRVETGKQIGPGYAAASDILRLEVLDRFGGIYSDGDNLLEDLGEVEEIAASAAGFAVNKDREGNTGNSAFVLPRDHPFARLYLAAVEENYGRHQHELFPAEIAGWAPGFFDSEIGRVNRNSVMWRTGPNVLTGLAGQLGYTNGIADYPALTGIVMNSAASWLRPLPAPAPEPHREHTLDLTKKIVQTLVRDIYNRDGDLHLTAVEEAVGKHPRPDLVWQAVLGFLAGQPELAERVRRVTDGRFRDGARQEVGVPTAAMALLDVTPDTEQTWLGEFSRAARFRSVPKTPGFPLTTTASDPATTPDTASDTAATSDIAAQQPPAAAQSPETVPPIAPQPQPGSQTQTEPQTEPESAETPATPPLDRARIFADESWRHSDRDLTHPDATWATHANPVPATRINAVRDQVPPHRHRAESGGLTDNSVITIENGEPRFHLSTWQSPVGYETRRLSFGPGQVVQDRTFRLHLNNPGGYDLTAFKEAARDGNDQFWNRGFALPRGDQLHVNIEFTDDPAQATGVITVTAPGTPANQLNIPLDATSAQFAHEIGGHFGGLDDTYHEGPQQNPSIFQHHRGKTVRHLDGTTSIVGRGRIVNDDNIMGQHAAQVTPANLWLLDQRGPSPEVITPATVGPDDRVAAPPVNPNINGPVGNPGRNLLNKPRLFGIAEVERNPMTGADTVPLGISLPTKKGDESVARMWAEKTTTRPVRAYNTLHPNSPATTHPAPWDNEDPARQPIFVYLHAGPERFKIRTTGGTFRVDGATLADAVLADPDFRQTAQDRPDAPIVLLACESGQLNAPGGGGYDFRRALVERGHERQVFAPTQTINLVPVFAAINVDKGGVFVEIATHPADAVKIPGFPAALPDNVIAFAKGSRALDAEAMAVLERFAQRAVGQARIRLTGHGNAVFGGVDTGRARAQAVSLALRPLVGPAPVIEVAAERNALPPLVSGDPAVRRRSVTMALIEPGREPRPHLDLREGEEVTDWLSRTAVLLGEAADLWADSPLLAHVRTSLAAGSGRLKEITLRLSVDPGGPAPRLGRLLGARGHAWVEFVLPQGRGSEAIGFHRQGPRFQDLGHTATASYEVPVAAEDALLAFDFALRHLRTPHRVLSFNSVDFARGLFQHVSGLPAPSAGWLANGPDDLGRRLRELAESGPAAEVERVPPHVDAIGFELGQDTVLAAVLPPLDRFARAVLTESIDPPPRIQIVLTHGDNTALAAPRAQQLTAAVRTALTTAGSNLTGIDVQTVHDPAATVDSATVRLIRPEPPRPASTPIIPAGQSVKAWLDGQAMLNRPVRNAFINTLKRTALVDALEQLRLLGADRPVFRLRLKTERRDLPAQDVGHAWAEIRDPFMGVTVLDLMPAQSLGVPWAAVPGEVRALSQEDHEATFTAEFPASANDIIRGLDTVLSLVEDQYQLTRHNCTHFVLALHQAVIGAPAPYAGRWIQGPTDLERTLRAQTPHLIARPGFPTGEVPAALPRRENPLRVTELSRNPLSGNELTTVAEFSRLAGTGNLTPETPDLGDAPDLLAAALDTPGEVELKRRVRALAVDALTLSTLVPSRDNTLSLLSPQRLQTLLTDLTEAVHNGQDPIAAAGLDYDPGAPLPRRLVELGLLDVPPALRDALRADPLFQDLLRNPDALSEALFAASGEFTAAFDTATQHGVPPIRTLTRLGQAVPGLTDILNQANETEERAARWAVGLLLSAPVPIDPALRAVVGGTPGPATRPAGGSWAREHAVREWWRSSDPAVTPDHRVTDPLSCQDIQHLRDQTPPLRVSSEDGGLTRGGRPWHGPIGYDLRHLEVAGRRVRLHTVRLHLEGPHTPEFRARVEAAADRYLNQGHRLPSGEQLLVEVEFTDRADAHGVVHVTSPGTRADQTHWPADAREIEFAHELGHFLGLHDEYLDDIDDPAVFQHRAGAGRVATGPGLMTAAATTGEAVLEPRNLHLLWDRANNLLGENPLPTKESVTEPGPGFLASTADEREFRAHPELADYLPQVAEVLARHPNLAATGEAELAAVRAYTDTLSPAIDNHFNGKPAPAYTEPLIRLLSSAVTRLPTRFTGIATRCQIMDLAEARALFVKGSVYTDRGFFRARAGELRLFPTRQVIVTAQVHNGAYLSSVSRFAGEREVLLPPGTRFTVASARESNGQLEVTLRQLDPTPTRIHPPYQGFPGPVDTSDFMENQLSMIRLLGEDPEIEVSLATGDTRAFRDELGRARHRLAGRPAAPATIEVRAWRSAAELDEYRPGRVVTEPRVLIGGGTGGNVRFVVQANAAHTVEERIVVAPGKSFRVNEVERSADWTGMTVIHLSETTPDQEITPDPAATATNAPAPPAAPHTEPDAPTRPAGPTASVAAEPAVPSSPVATESTVDTTLGAAVFDALVPRPAPIPTTPLDGNRGIRLSDPTLPDLPTHDGYFTFLAHGDSTGNPLHNNTPLTPRTVADLLLRAHRDGHWDGAKPLLFASCGAGQGGRESFAAKVLAELRAHGITAEALAPNGPVYFVPGGTGQLIVASGVGVDATGRPAFEPGGTWVRLANDQVETLGAQLDPEPAELPVSDLDGAVRLGITAEEGALYRHPDYLARVADYESALGAHFFHDPAATTELRNTLQRLVSLLPRATGPELCARFAGGDPTVLGEPDRGLSTAQLAQIAAQGNQRELAAAVLNVAFQGGRLSLAGVLNPIIGTRNWALAERLGLDVDCLKAQAEHRERGIEHVLAVVREADPHQAVPSAWPSGQDRAARALEIAQLIRPLLTRAEGWEADAGAFAADLWRTTELAEPDWRPGRLTSADLDGSGVVPSARERQGLDDGTLRWVPRPAKVELDRDTARHHLAQARGIRLTGGAALNVAKAMYAYRLVGRDAGDPERFLHGLLGWLLPTGEHSLHEVLTAAAVSGSFPALGRTLTEDAAILYRELPGLTPTDRAQLGRPPHEQLYLHLARTGGLGEARPHLLGDSEWRRNNVGQEHPTPDPHRLAGSWLLRHDLTAEALLDRLGLAHFLAFSLYTDTSFPLMNALLRAPIGQRQVMAVQLTNMVRNRQPDAWPMALQSDPVVAQLLNQAVPALDSPDWPEFIKPVLGRVNAHLDPLINEMSLHCHLLMDALRLLPPALGQVWRGDFSVGDTGTWYGRWLSPILGRTDITFTEFTSTSRGKATAINFATAKPATALAHPVLLKIETAGAHGHDIAPFSAVPNEQEVLLAPGAKITVSKRHTVQFAKGDVLETTATEQGPSLAFPSGTTESERRRIRARSLDGLTRLNNGVPVRESTDLTGLAPRIGVTGPDHGRHVWGLTTLLAAIDGPARDLSLDRLTAMRALVDLGTPRFVLAEQSAEGVKRLNELARRVWPLDALRFTDEGLDGPRRLLDLAADLLARNENVTVTDLDRRWRAQHPESDPDQQPMPAQAPPPDALDDLILQHANDFGGQRVLLDDPSLTPEQRNAFTKAVLAIPPSQTYFTLLVHNTGQGGLNVGWNGMPVTGSRLGRLLITLKDNGLWDGQRPIRLVSCAAALGTANSVAAALAERLHQHNLSTGDSLRAEVYAPTGPVWFLPTGSTGELIAGPAVGADAIGPAYVRGGNWMWFRPAPNGDILHTKIGAYLAEHHQPPGELPAGLHQVADSAVLTDIPGTVAFGGELYRDPGYPDRAERFEDAIGQHAYHSVGAIAAARAGLHRLHQVLSQAHPDRADVHRAFLKGDPGSAGQLGHLTAEGFAELIGTGNLRELMTAFYNAAYFAGSPLGLQPLLNTLVRTENWDRARELGLNLPALRAQAAYLNGPLRPVLHRLAGVVSETLGRTFDLDVFAGGNVLAASPDWLGAGGEYLTSLRARRNGGPDRRLDARFTRTPRELRELGIELSQRELDYLLRNPGLSPLLGLVSPLGDPLPGHSGPELPLSWVSGQQALDLDTTSAWHRDRTAQGFRLIAGVSGTAAKMANAALLLGIPGQDPAAFTQALLGWMLTGRDHSAYEILAGAGLVFPLPGVDLADAATMYRSLPGISLAELRALPGTDGLLPHEAVYLAQADPAEATVARHSLARFRDVAGEPAVRTWLARNDLTAADVLALLAPAHVAALRAYRGPAHQTITAQLRTGGPDRHAQLVREALALLPPVRGTVWHSGPRTGPLQPGHGVTRSRQRAEEALPPNGMLLRAELTGRAAKDISIFAGAPDEVLLPPGTQLHVTRREQLSEHLLVETAEPEPEFPPPADPDHRTARQRADRVRTALSALTGSAPADRADLAGLARQLGVGHARPALDAVWAGQSRRQDGLAAWRLGLLADELTGPLTLDRLTAVRRSTDLAGGISRDHLADLLRDLDHRPAGAPVHNEELNRLIEVVQRLKRPGTAVPLDDLRTSWPYLFPR